MFTDLTGKTRLKIGLHTHTTLSDGHKTPEEAAAIYKAAGYDAIAITDHWVYGEGGEIDGLTILSGCEYNVGGVDEWTGVHETYHIVGVGMTRDPEIPEDYLSNHDGRIRDRVRDMVDRIRKAGGLAILAHPAWSLNTSEQILGCADFDATEIYNSVSNAGQSRRPYSGYFVDILANNGVVYPLVATDDTHYYNSDDAARSYIMVKAPSNSQADLVRAIRQKDFYATQGPELHIKREGNILTVDCSPCSMIVVLSNLAWCPDRVTKGEGLTHAEYRIKDADQWVRVEVTDQNGNCAWSNIIEIR